MRLLAAVAVGAGLVLWLGDPAVAQPRGEAAVPVTMVRDIAVDATAENAVTAREAALRDGQRRAFDRVLRRMTLREDWPRLPKVAAADLPGLVNTLEINDEKTSGVRYLAKLTVGFHEARIKSLLRTNGIPYTDTRADPALLLPVMERGGILLLFDEANIWRQAWDGMAADEDGLLPLRLPLGDLEDMTSVAPEAAVSGSAARLQHMAERYGTDTVIVAHAIPSLGVAGVGASITVNITWHGEEGSQTAVLSVPGEPGEELEATIARAAGEVVLELEEMWKRRTLLVFGSEVTLSVYVPISDLSEWIAMRDRLGRVSMVQDFRVESITRRGAQLIIRFLAEPARMELPLAQQGLELEQVEGYWQLGWHDRDVSGTSGEAPE